ncbi:hypothetical protein H6F67_06830 [Microcoleus sp. FACHB-1515]|uniref:DALR anticodon-binding domain-containing protein n=1 Tax=Cyanophyceae TaxID=3028117 RepID=UPI0016875908|nr:DALR anticodon-binding domain-containing protein [Microcoleus sp. FACHB-1515]MBD2089565.1 hypothetical protein [Microcoleus sp. FACHB-1515]
MSLSRSIATSLCEPIAPLRRHSAQWPICYESAIARKLAAQQQRSPAVVAAEIAATVTVVEGWQIHTSPSGLLRLQASEPNIAAELQRLLAVPTGCTSELHVERSRPPDQLFRVQYVHARCWMLLQSAGREGWFERSLPPPALPWLTRKGNLRLQQQAERQAIGLLFDAVDALALEQTSDRLWKQAVSLSCQLDAFHAACRIWSEFKEDLPLAQARLGLTWAGQQLLQVLLNALDLDAPKLL